MMVLVEFDDLKRIESIARHALPTDDKADVITHLHSAIERMLETAQDTPPWWFE